MKEQDNTERKPMKTGLKILLGVSLAMNFVVIGLVAGAMIRHDGWKGAGKRPPALGAFGAPYIMALPRDERRQLFRSVRQTGEQNLPDRSERQALYGAVLNALRAEPFDPDVLAQVVTQQAATTISVQKSIQSEWLETVSGWSPRERLSYADAVEKILERGPSSRK